MSPYEQEVLDKLNAIANSSASIDQTVLRMEPYVFTCAALLAMILGGFTYVVVLYFVGRKNVL